MGKLLKLISLVNVPVCLAFFISEPIGMPHVVVSISWVTMLLSGIIYEKFPQLDNCIWSIFHFWCHSIGLPLLIVSFLGYTLGERGLIQVFLALGSYPLVICIGILFIRSINLYLKDK